MQYQNYIVESFEAGAAELFLPQKEKFLSIGVWRCFISMKKKMKTASSAMK